MKDTSRAMSSEKVLSSNLPHKGAQIIIGGNSVASGNQQGSGTIIDGQVAQIQADQIDFLPRNIITINDTPLNEVLREEKYASDVNGSDEVAGPAVFGVIDYLPHTHRENRPFSPVYKSKYINQLNQLKTLMTRMQPILDALNISDAAFNLPEAFAKISGVTSGVTSGVEQKSQGPSVWAQNMLEDNPQGRKIRDADGRIWKPTGELDEG
jgi:hypothetical protein